MKWKNIFIKIAAIEREPPATQGVRRDGGRAAAHGMHLSGELLNGVNRRNNANWYLITAAVGVRPGQKSPLPLSPLIFM